MECELCGKKTDKLYDVYIEGTLFKVCENCKRYGKIVKKEEYHLKNFNKDIEEKEIREVEEIVSPDAGKKIKEFRESLGLSREEFARKFNISEKIIERLEKGQSVDVSIVKRLEKKLNLKLTEEVVLYYDSKQKKSNEEETLTVGDILIIRE